jgi:hypothetical protein
MDTPPSTPDATQNTPDTPDTILRTQNPPPPLPPLPVTSEAAAIPEIDEEIRLLGEVTFAFNNLNTYIHSRHGRFGVEHILNQGPELRYIIETLRTVLPENMEYLRAGYINAQRHVQQNQDSLRF